MKILLANGSAYPTIGGVENSLRFIGRELLNSGHEVKIICLQKSLDESLRIEYEGIEIMRIPYRPKRWPHTRLLEIVKTVQHAIPAILDEFQPDAIWSRSTPVGLGIRRGGYQGSLLQIFSTNAKMSCRGLYLQTHGLPMMRRLKLLGLWPFDYLVSSRLEHLLIRQCEAVVFSENMYHQLLKSSPKTARSCHIIVPGVDREYFSHENGIRHIQKIENDYGLIHGEPIVLYVGRLSISKNIPMLIDAVSSLKTNAKLVLVGSGPDETHIKNYAEKIGLTERLIFAGSHHEMLPGFYAISKVSVLPTTIESFGQMYLESLASGTPTIGFAGDARHVLTETDRIIQDGKTGGVVRRISADALSEKIDSILSLDDNDYAKMSQRAREDVVDRFSWKKFVNEAIELSRLARHH